MEHRHQAHGGAGHTDWLRQAHSLFGSRPLTAEDPRAPPPPGFQGQLWPPQATLLHAMVGLEQRPYLRLEEHDDRWAERESAPLLRVTCARIAAEFSFGKTVLCVALVCASPLPRAYPQPLNLPVMGCTPGTNRLQVGKFHTSGYTFKPAGRGVFPSLTLRYHRLLRATLVVAAPSVISQWEKCVATFAPHLAVFTIENVRTLRAFHGFFRTEAMAGVDIVFLKAGKVATSFVAEGEPPPAVRQRALTRALAAATEGYAWGRMIVDDFDTIRLASEDIFLPALFTWVISATCRSTMVRQEVRPGASPADFIRANATLPILGAAADALFGGVLKLRCEEGYVGAHITSTTVDFRRIVVEGGRFVGILQDLGVPDEIVEMVAAGAVETAAERLNIRVSGLGDLVERVLETRTAKYRKAVQVLARIDRAREAVVAATAARRPRNSNEEVAEIRAALKDGEEAEAEAALDRLGGASSAFTNAARTLGEWAARERDEYGGRLQRMRENVRQHRCQGCMVPIEKTGDDCYVVNCCQILICGDCTVVGEGGRRRYIDRCPNCASAVNPARHLIYVGKDLDLEGALTDEALLAAPPPPSPEEGGTNGPGATEGGAAGEDPPDHVLWAHNPRLRALLQLVRGCPVAALHDGASLPIVDGLLVGTRRIPRPDGTPKKFLIFAMHAESTRHITMALEVVGIPHARLAGSRERRDAAVAAFRGAGGVDVLVATTNTDCAGLHLPETSTVVLYNRHNDKEVAKQAVGRAQRVGRGYSLEVVEIINEGEAERFA